MKVGVEQLHNDLVDHGPSEFLLENSKILLYVLVLLEFLEALEMELFVLLRGGVVELEVIHAPLAEHFLLL